MPLATPNEFPSYIQNYAEKHINRPELKTTVKLHESKIGKEVHIHVMHNQEINKSKTSGKRPNLSSFCG